MYIKSIKQYTKTLCYLSVDILPTCCDCVFSSYNQ